MSQPWSIALNFAGIRAINGLPFARLPIGGYEVTIDTSEIVPRKNDQSKFNLKLDYTVMDAEFRGEKKQSWLRIPGEGDKRPDLCVAEIRGALHSIGFTEQQTEGNLTLNEQVFNGRRAFIYVSHTTDAEGREQEERGFITEKQYLANKAVDLMKKAAARPSTTATAPHTGVPAAAPLSLAPPVAVSSVPNYAQPAPVPTVNVGVPTVGVAGAPAPQQSRDLAALIGARPN